MLNGDLFVPDKIKSFEQINPEERKGLSRSVILFRFPTQPSPPPPPPKKKKRRRRDHQVHKKHLTVTKDKIQAKMDQS